MADERAKGGGGGAGDDGDDDVTELDIDALRPGDLQEAAAAALEAVEGVGAGDRGESSSGDIEVAALQDELADLRNRAARTLADFENFRKRSERERDDVRRYAAAEPMRELVGVADNLERALGAGGSVDDLKRGVEMIHRQMHDLLRRFAVREVEAEGQPFDPAVHEAVLRVEDPGVERATVIEVLQRGYTLHDRLLRPAMVKVAVPGSGRTE